MNIEPLIVKQCNKIAFGVKREKNNREKPKESVIREINSKLI